MKTTIPGMMIKKKEAAEDVYLPAPWHKMGRVCEGYSHTITYGRQDLD
jgi:hypothetical protein